MPRSITVLMQYPNIFLLFEPKKFFFALRHDTPLINAIIAKANLQMLQRWKKV